MQSKSGSLMGCLKGEEFPPGGSNSFYCNISHSVSSGVQPQQQLKRSHYGMYMNGGNVSVEGRP